MTWTAQGSIRNINDSGITGTSSTLTSLLNNVASGDLIVLFVAVNSATIYGSSISGGGVNWDNSGNAQGHQLGSGGWSESVFTGKTTATGVGSPVLTYSASLSSGSVQGDAFEFSSSVGSWTLDGSAGFINNSGSNVMPSLTPSAAGDLYVGYEEDNATASGTMNPASYVAVVDGSGNGLTYCLNCTSGAQAPSWATAAILIAGAILVQETAAPAVVSQAEPLIPPEMFPPLSKAFGPGVAFETPPKVVTQAAAVVPTIPPPPVSRYPQLRAPAFAPRSRFARVLEPPMPALGFAHADTAIAQATSSVATQSVTLVQPVGIGDVICIEWGSPSPNSDTISDTAGNTWVTPFASANTNCFAYTIVTKPSFTGTTITSTGGGSGSRFLVADRFTVTGGAASFGTANSNPVTSGSSGNMGSLSSVPAGELLWGALQSGNASITFTAGSSNSKNATIGSQIGNTGGSGYSEYILSGAGGTESLTWSSSGALTSHGTWQAYFVFTPFALLPYAQTQWRQRAVVPGLLTPRRRQNADFVPQPQPAFLWDAPRYPQPNRASALLRRSHSASSFGQQTLAAAPFIWDAPRYPQPAPRMLVRRHTSAPISEPHTELIYVVQSASWATGSSGSFANNVTPGNSVILFIGDYNTVGGTITSSAPLYNGSPVVGAIQLYSVQNPDISPSNRPMYTSAWLLPNVQSAGTSVSYTNLNGNNDGSSGHAIAEIYGLGPAPYLDSGLPNPATNGADSGTAVSSGATGSLLSSIALIVGSMMNDNGAFTPSSTSWKMLSMGTAPYPAAGWQVALAPGGTYTFNGTIPASEQWSAGVVAIVPGVAPIEHTTSTTKRDNPAVKLRSSLLHRQSPTAWPPVVAAQPAVVEIAPRYPQRAIPQSRLYRSAYPVVSQALPEIQPLAGNTNSASNATSVTITIPSSTPVGSIVIVGVFVVTLDLVTRLIQCSSTGTTPLLLGVQQSGTESTPAALDAAVYLVKVTSADQGATITCSLVGGASGYWAISLEPYLGASPVVKVALASGTSASGVGTVTAPAALTDAGNEWAVYVAGGACENNAMSNPSGTVSRENIRTGDNMVSLIADSNGSVGPAGTSIGNVAFTTNAAAANILAAFTLGLAPASTPYPPITNAMAPRLLTRSSGYRLISRARSVVTPPVVTVQETINTIGVRSVNQRRRFLRGGVTEALTNISQPAFPSEQLRPRYRPPWPRRGTLPQSQWPVPVQPPETSEWMRPRFTRPLLFRRGNVAPTGWPVPVQPPERMQSVRRWSKPLWPRRGVVPGTALPNVYPFFESERARFKPPYPRKGVVAPTGWPVPVQPPERMQAVRRWSRPLWPRKGVTAYPTPPPVAFNPPISWSERRYSRPLWPRRGVVAPTGWPVPVQPPERMQYVHRWTRPLLPRKGVTDNVVPPPVIVPPPFIPGPQRRQQRPIRRTYREQTVLQQPLVPPPVFRRFLRPFRRFASSPAAPQPPTQIAVAIRIRLPETGRPHSHIAQVTPVLLQPPTLPSSERRTMKLQRFRRGTTVPETGLLVPVQPPNIPRFLRRWVRPLLPRRGKTQVPAAPPVIIFVRPAFCFIRILIPQATVTPVLPYSWIVLRLPQTTITQVLPIVQITISIPLENELEG